MGLFGHSLRNNSIPTRGTRMTEEEFKKWLIEYVDSDKNKQITKQELRQALRSLGLGWTWLKVRMAMIHVDINGNNCIEFDRELDKLIKYAAKHWGIVVVNE